MSKKIIERIFPKLSRIHFEVITDDGEGGGEDIEKVDFASFEGRSLYNKLFTVFDEELMMEDFLERGVILKDFTIGRVMLSPFKKGEKLESMKGSIETSNKTVNESNTSKRGWSSDIAHWFTVFRTENPQFGVIVTELSRWEDEGKMYSGYKIALYDEESFKKSDYYGDEYAYIKGFNDKKKIVNLNCKNGYTFLNFLDTLMKFWEKTQKRYNVYTNSCQSFCKCLLFDSVGEKGESVFFE